MSRYSGSFICKEIIPSVQHSHKVFYFLTSWLSINQSTSLYPSEHFTIWTLYLFLVMYPSTNTRFGRTTSTETTKNALAPSNSSYVIKIKFHYNKRPNSWVQVLFREICRDNHCRPRWRSWREIRKTDTALITPVQMDFIQIGWKSQLFSSFKEKYNYHLENMINNNKICTKFEIAKT